MPNAERYARLKEQYSLKAAEWRVKNRKYRNDKMAEWRADMRIRALQKVMDAHGLNGCHASIHPNMPADLGSHVCWGMLTFEHPDGQKGAAKKEGGWHLVQAIMSGRKNPKTLMILCRLHQIWNERFYGRIS